MAAMQVEVVSPERMIYSGAATMVLTFYTAAFYAEIFRGGIVSIERGQWDAARALGLRPWPMMTTPSTPSSGAPPISS